jgi:hypothetical protein
MAFVKTTWSDNALPAITAAQLNRIETGIGDAHAGTKDVRLRVSSPSGTNAVAGSGANPSIFSWPASTVAYDTDGMHPAGSTTRFTVVTAGMYIIFCQLWPQQQPPGPYLIQLRANGNTNFAYIPDTSQATFWEFGAMGMRYFAAGEYWEFLVQNSNGAGFQVIADMTAVRVPAV